jgi:hypothetical protein
MTANSETPEPLWVFERAVLAHAPEFDAACVARLRIAHDHNDDQGSISIRINAALTGFGKQTLMLSIRPEGVDACTVVAKSNDKLIPDRMFSMVPVSVTKSAAVSTLMLCLNATGTVLVPPSVDGTISGDANLDAFAKICKSKIIHLHLSKQQFKDGDLHQLRTFSGALRARVLKAQPFDYKRLNAGRGAIEKDWRVFGQSADPPPYCEPASTQTVLGKRPRGTFLSRVCDTMWAKGYLQSTLSCIIRTIWDAQSHLGMSLSSGSYPLSNSEQPLSGQLSP